MKNIILAGLTLVSGLACQGTTAIGGADAGCAVTIPPAGFLGPNILYAGNDSFQAAPAQPWPVYELVVTHDATAAVVVKMTLLSGNPSWVLQGSANDWHVKGYDPVSGSQMFEAPNVTGEFEESIAFEYTGQARVDVFECGASTPALSKTISWSSPEGVVSPDAGPVFLPDGGFPPDAGPVFPPDGGPGFGLDGGPILLPDGGPVWTDGGPIWTDGGPVFPPDGGPVIGPDGGYATDGGPVANPHGG